jgi:hypothetical protein
MDASCHGSVDGDVNEAEPVRPRDQAMRLDAWNSEPSCHFALGKAGAVIEPRRPGAELLVTFVERWRYDISHFAPCYFFLGMRFFSWCTWRVKTQNGDRPDNKALGDADPRSRAGSGN